MKASLRLERLVCRRSKDGGGRSEPYLWPILFRADAVLIAKAADLLLTASSLPGFPAHGANLDELKKFRRNAIEEIGPGWKAVPFVVSADDPRRVVGSFSDGDAKGIPDEVQRLEIQASTAGAAGFARVGFVVILLEKDTTGRDIVRAAHRIFVRELRREILRMAARKLLELATLRSTDTSNPELPFGLGPRHRLLEKAIAALLASETGISTTLFRELREGFGGVMMRDDVIGAVYRSRAIEPLEESFSFLWNKERTDSRNGAFELHASLVIEESRTA
jgi:hypothetical protein